jgi:mutator protein MutT
MIYRYCPVCGGVLKYEQREGNDIPVCQNPSCGFVFWQNPKPTVSAIIVNEQQEVLLAVRGIEPYRGKLDLPGGFLQEGEHPDEGIKREIREELGVDVELADNLGIIMDRYGQGGDSTLNITFVAKISGGTPHAADDVARITWVNSKEVKREQFAFANNWEFLKRWQALEARNFKGD